MTMAKLRNELLGPYYEEQQMMTPARNAEWTGEAWSHFMRTAMASGAITPPCGEGRRSAVPATVLWVALAILATIPWLWWTSAAKAQQPAPRPAPAYPMPPGPQGTTIYPGGGWGVQQGGTTYFSNGSNAQTVGPNTFYSNGVTCTTIGTMVFCQ